jgi:hypothetical protein
MSYILTILHHQRYTVLAVGIQDYKWRYSCIPFNLE